MVAAFRKDLARSSRAFASLIWPVIRPMCGGGDVRYVEDSGHETDRDLDILAGIDAYQVLHSKGIRGIASRVQAVDRSYDTFTIRYQRLSAAGFDTEYKKRLMAVRSNGELLSAYLCVQAYVSKDWQTLLALAVVRVRDLYEFVEREREQFTSGQFPLGRQHGGCYLDTVVNDGAAHFLVVPWSRLKAGGVEIKIKRRPHAERRHSSRESTEPGPLSPDPWTWTHLPCNATGTGDPALHKCLHRVEGAREYWAQKLRWILPNSTIEQRLSIIDHPIDRARMIEWFGARWAASNDAVLRDPGMVDG